MISRWKTLEEGIAGLALTHPAWMVERWVTFYGMEAAGAICRHGQTQPPLSVRLESASADAQLVEAGIHLEAGALLTSARTVKLGDVTATEAFRSGRVRIQDEGSQLIGEISAVAGGDSDRKPRKILDACAAPGGKTLILAERNPGARILACEVNSGRLEQLRERLAPHAGHVECRQADASALAEASMFDIVLADVPCSGTGTLGRNPEIRHRLKLEDLARQAERQRAILKAAIRAAKPGGSVVYSTCSLEPEENEQVIAAVLAEAPEARQVPLKPPVEMLLGEGILMPGGAERLRACLTREGALRLLPGALPTDGFFVALIEKTG
jgi:16S rRNA (cytosine967-C5)-methyltransferase